MNGLPIPIEKMTEAQAKELLEKLVEKLNDLDGEDFFGSEGWMHMFGISD